MPDDDEVSGDGEDGETDVMSRPRTQPTFDDEDEDDSAFDDTGAELEEEYVRLNCRSTIKSFVLIILYKFT